MSDTYGSGLTFDVQGGASDAAPGLPADVPANTGDQNAPMAAPGPSFGSSIRGMFGGPQYKQPDPETSALDQSAGLLEQRVKRAGEVATNPLAQIFAPEQAAAARDFMPKAAEALQKIQQQRAAIQSGKVQAQTLGLEPGEVPNEASQADRVEVAVGKALKGDLRSFQGLAAVDPQRAASIQDRVHETVAGHLDKAQLAFDSLASMQNEGQYRAKVNQLRQDGTLTDLESMGMKLPSNFEAFQGVKGAEGKALREARIAVEGLRARIEERTGGVPMDKKEAETYASRLTTESGLPLNNTTFSRINGKRVAIVNGMADIRDLGTKFNLASPEQRKAFHEDAKAAVPEKEIEKVRAFERIGTLATKQPDGKYIPPEGLMVGKERVYMNTNPNVMQGISEGFAAELRGGQGGATSGLLNIEASKRGAVQGLLDKIKAGYGGALNTITGDQVRSYLTTMTQKQQREVLDGLREHNAKTVSDRLAPIARQAGELGLNASALGLGKDEVKGVDDAIAQGRQSTIDRFTPRARSTGGGDGGIYLDNPPPVLVTQPDNPNQQHPPLPAPVAPPANPGQSTMGGVQQPAPTLSPQPGAGSPPVWPEGGRGTAPAAPGGGPGQPPAPVRVAGLDVNVPLPQGASPSYVKATQRIESGNERDPWTAGTKNSSASGAFQFIDSTWKDNKPSGAPDRARDATPAQQAEAFATLTAKNAATLKAGQLPVNDVSLYIAHNLGAGGSSKLMSADPGADARSIVGEAAAKNNPMFFRGRPTVATVLDRYADAIQKGAHGDAPDDTGPKPNKPNSGGAMAAEASPAGPGPRQRVSFFTPNAITNDPEQFRKNSEETNRAIRNVGDTATEYAPAIGSTVGAVVGGLSPVPGGAVIGGMAGGGAGQVFKDYMQGREQNPQEIAKQTALGGVLGVAPVGRPLVGAAARVAGVGAVEAGDAAVSGEGVDVADAGLKGLAYGLGGEALGRFVSSAGAGAYKALSRYTTSAQHELSASAGKLSEARQIMEAEPPKLPGAGGVESPNPKFEAAKKQADDATTAIKDHGQNPDDMVHAYEQAKSGVSAGEAATLRKAESEKRSVSEGYNQLRQDVRENGVGVPKPNQPVPDGPLSTIRTAENPTGKVEAKFAPDAEHAEMLVKAPAADWGHKWDQLQSAGSELIKKRMAFLQNADKPSADAMDDIFKGVRNQQKAAAKYVFGEEGGKQAIKRLEDLDRRYAKLMNATQGMDYGKMRSVIAAGNTPERRELEKNFREFAGDDPSAMRAFNAMKAGAKGRMTEEAKLMVPIITAESLAHVGGVPTLGAVSLLVGGHRLYKVMQEFANAKVLGKAVKFADFLNQEFQVGAARMAAGDATRRGVVQSKPDMSAAAGALPLDSGARTAPIDFTNKFGANANWDAFNSVAPLSENIDDRRDEPLPEFASFLRKADWKNLSAPERRAVLRDAQLELRKEMMKEQKVR